MKATASDDQIARLSLRKGDVIITKDSESSDDIGIPSFVAEEIPGLVCGYHLALLRSHPGMTHGEFLSFALQGDYVRSQFSVSAVGLTRYGLGKYNIANTVVALPSPDEQQVIANFLARETAQIDTLIAKQQQLIELLQEKRQALISHVVTKGLNPDAPMNDSGVEWLGEVPAHWTVTQVRRVLHEIEQGRTLESENRLAESDEWAVLKSGCVNWGVFRPEEHKALTKAAEFNVSDEVQPGDVLMSRASGSVDLVGSVALVQETRPLLLLSDKTFRLVTNEQIDNRFLVLTLQSSQSRAQIELLANGAEGLPNNITKPSINALYIALPSLSEQTEIVNFVNRTTKQIDLLVKKCNDTILILQERRTALISAAVTGKIDVRSLVN